jgi:thiamine biosynthesis lipoprotein
MAVTAGARPTPCRPGPPGARPPGRRILAAVRAVLLLVAAWGLMGAFPLKEVRLTGSTMGTAYHVTVVGSAFSGIGDLKNKIDNRLAPINQSMSTYRTDSEISRFNRMTRTDERLCPSDDFSAVMAVAREVHDLTGGAWDATVGPLVDLWGFGAAGTRAAVPSPAALAEAMAAVGFGHIRFHEDGCMGKDNPAVALDLASIAKGYGADAVAALIRDAGFERFLVEIGGEVVAGGTRMDGKAWQVGVAAPESDAPPDSVFTVLPLSDQAMATSGSYRIFFEADGQSFCHVLDPRTGRPVTTGVVSATVIAQTCVLADGLATGLMVMGPEKGLALVEGMDAVECLIVVQDPTGRLVAHVSSGLVRP